MKVQAAQREADRLNRQAIERDLIRRDWVNGRPTGLADPPAWLIAETLRGFGRLCWWAAWSVFWLALIVLVGGSAVLGVTLVSLDALGVIDLD